MHPATAILSLLLTPVVSAAAAPDPLLSRAACARTVVASQGDTCATVASAAGTTVSQFLNLNPDLQNCALVAGRSYCVAAAAGGGVDPTTTAAPEPTGAPLKVSKDGSCGGGVTCLGSGFGECCSEHGWCGTGEDYCTEGCQAAFGTCAGGGGGGGTTTIGNPGGGGGEKTVTVTRTATAVTSVTVTSVSVTTATAAGPTNTLCPIQQGIISTCVDFHKSKAGETCDELTLEYGCTTAQLKKWNPSIACPRLTAGQFVCIGTGDMWDNTKASPRL